MATRGKDLGSLWKWRTPETRMESRVATFSQVRAVRGCVWLIFCEDRYRSRVCLMWFGRGAERTSRTAALHVDAAQSRCGLVAREAVS